METTSTSSLDAFQTVRMVTERARKEHFDELVRLHQDPKVMATLGGVMAEDETASQLGEWVDHWERNGYGLWIFRDKNSGDFIGRAGLRRGIFGGRDEVELAYALRAEYWGRGLATEMSLAILDIGFGKLRLNEIVAFTLPSNLASRRVIEKSGFIYEHDIIHAGLPHVLYRRRANHNVS